VSERKTTNWLNSFVEYASIGEAPTRMLFWTGVATIAGALRRQVWLEFPLYQWTPCFYVILVAPPGIVSKSTTANIGINLLREIPGIKFGPDSATWQALVQCFAASSISFCEYPEDILKQKHHTMSALTMCVDELGTFLDPSDRGMVDTLVHMWDGKQGAFEKITKGSGSDTVINPWINMIACTTPGWLKAHLPEHMIGGGFTSRCIFVFADTKRKLVAYPDEDLPPHYFKLREDLIHDLEIMSRMVGRYILSPEARVFGKKWYEDHWAKGGGDLEGEKFAGYLARKQAHIHKLAIVMSAAESSELIIREETLKLATEFTAALEGELPRVFATVGQTVTGKNIGELIQIARVKRKINKQDLYRLVFSTMGHKDFEDALNSAYLAGHISLVSEAGIVYIVATDSHSGD
jgi:hypothetical protein